MKDEKELGAERVIRGNAVSSCPLSCPDRFWTDYLSALLSFEAEY